MAPRLTTIDASEPLDRILDAIARDGGVIVSSFLEPELLNDSMRAIEPFFSGGKMYGPKSAQKDLGDDFFPEGSQRAYGLLAKMPEQIIKIIRLNIWQGVMARFLNGEFVGFNGANKTTRKSGYILSSTAAIRLVPGAERQALHRDDVNYGTGSLHDPKNPLFTPMVGCLIAGSRATYKNGATAVIPGSHLWGPDRAPKVEECTYAEMEPGSALFTLGNAKCLLIATYHGGGTNQCQKTDPDADQQEILSTPIETARSFPDDIHRLTGYYKAVGGVGFIGDHQDPVEFLHVDTNGVGKFSK
ncbi:60S ribosomal protein L34-B [Fusarium oxysporum f. sp. albedinis]|nr:60S ribosomal protein L34-B [Fusarium oxysporum f. sp. albedinis]